MPKILHGLIAGAGDYFTVKLAARLYGKGIIGWIVMTFKPSFLTSRPFAPSPRGFTFLLLPERFLAAQRWH